MQDVVVLIDREQGGTARMASNGLRLHAAFRITFLLDVLVSSLARAVRSVALTLEHSRAHAQCHLRCRARCFICVDSCWHSVNRECSAPPTCWL